MSNDTKLTLCLLTGFMLGYFWPASDLLAEAPVASEAQPLVPYNAEDFAALRVTEAWQKYGDRLTWGKGQCLAILDDGCDLKQPQWQAKLPWGPKVLVTYDAVDGDDDPAHVKPGYHGTTVGYPSSIYYQNTRGVAYHDYVAHVRSVSVVHLTKDETKTISAALQWVIDHHKQYNITTINLAVLDDERHQEPVPTSIDKPLSELAKLGIWVSAPCGNHNYTDGISWPACQPECFAIGATVPGKHTVYLDRFSNTDLLVAARATSSSNAYACGCAMILREAIEKSGYDWKKDGKTLPDVMLAIFKKTGRKVQDAKTKLDFRELDLLAAADHVFAKSSR
jgi:hypothetical protein